jgi:hypothetical protein
MEKESSGQRPVEANSTGGQGSRGAVAPSDDDDDDSRFKAPLYLLFLSLLYIKISLLDICFLPEGEGNILVRYVGTYLPE